MSGVDSVNPDLDRFGVLNRRWTIEFDGGSISPVSGFDEVTAWVDSYGNQDGFLYPPMARRVVLDPRTNEVVEEVPKTIRPALIHQLPASHTLRLSDSGAREQLRRGIGALVIHLLGYLFGTRLQFWDWWFDGRVPIQSTHNITFSEATTQDFLSHCCRTWRSWTDKERRLLTNVLYMHCRAPSYEWDWERFTIEYMVLDGCWKLAELRHGVKDEGHAKRIDSLCRKFGIPSDGNLVEKIVRLRNSLFHEALWDGSQPCTGVGGGTFLQPYNLRRLNQRLIPALLGYDTSYIQTCWGSMSPRVFSPPSMQSNP